MSIPEEISVPQRVAPFAKQKRLLQWALVAVLAVIVAIAAAPSYFSGQWPWSAPLKAPQINQIKALRTTALDLPGWQVNLQQEVRIGGNDWGLTEYLATDAAAATNGFALLLRPQPWHDDQPEVEWVDIIGSRGWQVSDLHRIRFSVSGDDGQSIPVTARYFRGVDEQRTFAVVQWYAWPSGGHPAPGRWFWADQAQQWTERQRMPWVAVSVFLPIEPIGNIRPYTEEAIAIGQTIQTSLMTSIFSGN
ncbi:MAG: cyanoexosortase B system-associated protein [Cyanobacteria bacterium J06626_18]